jgi:transposase
LSGGGAGVGKRSFGSLAESAQSDRTVSQVARAHGIAPGQLFTWRRQLLAAAIERHEVESGFVPVRITPGAVTAAAASAESHIDIRLASGIVISVGRCVEIEPLRRVLTALAVQ